MRNNPQLAAFLDADDNKAIKKLFDAIDGDGNGQVTKEEFLAKFDPDAVEAVRPPSIPTPPACLPSS
jgi:hypothetical protein